MTVHFKLWHWNEVDGIELSDVDGFGVDIDDGFGLIFGIALAAVE